MTRYAIEPTSDAIDPITGKHTGEHDLLMLCDDGVWDWLGTFASRKEAQAELRAIRDQNAAIDGAERQYQAQYAHACGYRD